MIKTKNRGFTLIELLIVIAIIAILAGIIVATLGNPTGEARDSTRCQAVDSIGDAAQQYLVAGSASNYPDDIADLVTGGHISSEPVEPTGDGDGNNVYEYSHCLVGGQPRVGVGTTLEVDAKDKAGNDFSIITCDAPGGVCSCVDDAISGLCNIAAGACEIKCNTALAYCIAR